ncbi:MAG TPA: integron integrase [Pyrinomonadaceae bacterium]|nr:integron integrase [Pyrinomonadaceae bacterium]
MSEKPRLLELVRQVSRARELSRKTENAYINHIRRFQNFHGEHDLEQIGTSGIDAFLNHLKATENLAVSTQNQALSALAFLYRDVFGQENAAHLKIAKRTKPAGKLPVIFTPEEARKVLSKMRGDSLLVAALMYGSGLRLSEAVALRVGDLDFRQREIIVRDARTGKRERTTILPEAIIPHLKRHLANAQYLHEDDCLLGYGKVYLPKAIERKYPNAGFDRCWQFVFPSHHLTAGKTVNRFHLAESTVQKAVSEAILRANIFKQACCQTFRYSFAARLFERNYDIRRIQTLLGHKNLKTTAIYMQFAACRGNMVRSPLDN